MSSPRLLLTTALAMIAFAGNSLLCRLALRTTNVDAASFTSVRLVSSALVLWLIVRARGGSGRGAGSWPSALALFAYAAGFSFAYLQLSAGTGALLLFGAVQATMIGYGLRNGEALAGAQWAGLALAFLGLIALLLPGISAPPALPAALMLIAGIAWGIYSLRGRRGGDATQVTADNFLRAIPFALLLSAVTLPWSHPDHAGLLYAVASGALASGVGYAIWYTALKELRTTTAATVQLSVPVITAIGGILLLDEPMDLRLAVASIAILGGVALVILQRPSA